LKDRAHSDAYLQPQVGAIRRARLATAHKSAFQRWQCLWVRAGQDLPAETIAQSL